MNKLLLTLVLLANTFCLFAQRNFQYKAILPKIDSQAFYRISLPPGLLAKCQVSMADIRVVDQYGRPVPYIFGSQLPVNDKKSFSAFPQVAAGNQPDTLTTFIADNAGRLTINQMSLLLRNTSVERRGNLSGSDDLKNWYAIKENIRLEKAKDAGGTTRFEQLINFPASNYRYFKIQVNNKRQVPVAILQAGIYKAQTITPAFIVLTDVKFKQKDSADVSRVFVDMDDAYLTNKLHLTLAGAKYFNRRVTVYDVQNGQAQLIDTVISSAGPADLYLSGKSRRYMLQIQNEDNPPLIVKDVAAYQLDQSLISYLDNHHKYRIYFGDRRAKSPVYDLHFFSDSIQRSLPVLKTSALTKNPIHQSSRQINIKRIPTWAVWATIAIVVLLLGFLTYKMTVEVNKRAKA